MESQALSDRQLQTIVKLVYDHAGITLHSGKRELIVARLQKRMRQGSFADFNHYLKHLEDDKSGEELITLLDCISTNHTSFFREEQHFKILGERVAPWLLSRPAHAPLRGWCAASSSGEEPYTIAITLLDHLPEAAHARVRLMASDISTRVLKKASAAVYPLERVSGLPKEMLRKHFERGCGPQEGQARVKAATRKLVEFRRINLLEGSRFEAPFEFIFCRNVMIYFDKIVQQRVVSMLERNLAPGGWLFIAHSESLNGIEHSLQNVAPAVFRKKDS
jgi:chemotaxis protein methyltransferase CheR